MPSPRLVRRASRHASRFRAGLCAFVLATLVCVPGLVRKGRQPAGPEGKPRPSAPAPAVSLPLGAVTGVSEAGRELAFTAEALAWARRDPEGALRWAAAQPAPSQREDALERVCAAIAEWDPALAVDCADRLDFPWRDRGFLPGLVRQWAEKDRAAAIAWAGRRPDEETRNDYLTFIAIAWAQREPAAAAAWVDGAIDAAPAREQALLAVLPHWFDRDAAAAEAWLSARCGIPGSGEEM